ncbi:hypothetical protein D4R89_10115 [bacterium]|nr:MAG: hypothetical protein D4R89_10115 [bacterium]
MPDATRGRTLLIKPVNTFDVMVDGGIIALNIRFHDIGTRSKGFAGGLDSPFCTAISFDMMAFI